MFRLLIPFVFCAGPVLAEPAPQKPPEIRPSVQQVQTSNIRFNRWLSGFAIRAEAAGVRRETLDRAFARLTYDTAVIERDRTQNEFSKTIWDYLDTAVSDARIRNGRAALERHRSVLRRIEETHGVDADIIAAIWGLESAYGAVRGRTPTIDALATLAYDGRRGAFFEGELIAALLMLQQGDVRLDQMVGSWAGAMGHTQFMPSSYQQFAVDGDGDGDRDIWGDDPTDALASAAHYLSQNGWVLGQPWATEVRLPSGFDYLQARRDVRRLPSEWAAMGVVGLDGAPVEDHAPASVLLPAGHQGPAFLVFPNFDVIETYNTADAYVIAVGHLADRLSGGGPIEGAWPRSDRALSYDERVELQERLTASGFDTQKIDGLIGPLTINAIRSYQQANDLVPDGYASVRLLDRLR